MMGDKTMRNVSCPVIGNNFVIHDFVEIFLLDEQVK